MKSVGIIYDDWQKEILEYKGDIMLCKGRRIGGTEIFSIKAAERMIKQPGVKIVFISLTEEQAKLCISVALEHLTRYYKNSIAKGKKSPQVSKIFLKNGSTFQVRPVGNTGNAVRGFDGDILGIDEAPWQPQMMWKAARPIISTNDGEIWMWGTPADDEGYFFEQWIKAYENKDPHARFKVWYLNSEEVLFNRPVSESWTQKQHDGAIRILAEEKKDMTEEEYANEYLGQFMSSLRRVFHNDWIDGVCTIKGKEDRDPENRKPIEPASLGCDIASMGDDESTFEGLDKKNEKIRQWHHEITKKTLPTDTEDKILSINQLYDNQITGIGIDSGGMGIGVLAHLLREDSTKNKVVGLDNAKMIIDKDGGKKRIQKESMYYNFKELGERGVLELFDKPEIRASLKSIQVGENGRISGRYSHIVEGLIRAAELLKGKDLNPTVYTIKV